jgi:hypothetical protein
VNGNFLHVCMFGTCALFGRARTYWRRRVSKLADFEAAVLVELDVDRKCVNQLSYVNASMRLGRTGRFVCGGRGLIFGL